MINREYEAFSPSYGLAPPPSFSVSKLSLFLSLILSRQSSLLTGEWGVGMRGRGQTIRRRRESLVLHNSFNTLCIGVSDQISLRSYLPCSAGASCLSTSYTRRITSVTYNLQPIGDLSGNHFLMLAEPTRKRF
jgi:hypothetical protein